MNLQHFQITIGTRTAPRLSFPAMAPDACTAVAQHADLAKPGERVEVTPAQRMRAELQALADEIKARAQAARQLRRAMAIEPVTLPARAEPARPYISTAYATCMLCGSPSDDQVCAHCNDGLRRHGL